MSEIIIETIHGLCYDKSISSNERRYMIHYTHKRRMRQLYLEGYSRLEIAIMYKLPLAKVGRVTRGLKRPESV